jgi:hypothetical protein
MADLRVNGFVHYEALDSLRPTLDNTGGQPPTEVIMSRLSRKEHKQMRYILLLLITVLGLSSPVFSLDDTPENRMAQAERYSNVMPLGELLNDLAQQFAQQLPPEEQEHFIDLMTKHLDIDSLQKSVNEVMVKHFTAEELSALADFYGSSVGKSAMKKFGEYMADAMPVIQAEMVNAMSKAQQEKESQIK